MNAPLRSILVEEVGEDASREGLRDIEFHSLCEHHVLPFYGRMHVAYRPGRKIIGLSKIPRLVDLFARRLQVQERLTEQVADALVQQHSATLTQTVRGDCADLLPLSGANRHWVCPECGATKADFEELVCA